MAESGSEPCTSTTMGIFPLPFGSSSLPTSLTPFAVEGCIAHVEGDASARLLFKGYPAFGAIRERDDLAVGTIRPAIGVGPCTVFLWTKLAGFTGEHAPAQCVAV